MISFTEKEMSSITSESSAESDDEVLYPYNPEAPLVSSDTFYYPVNLITNSINAAIYARNFERAIELINNGKELNLADNRGFTALHVAAQSQNLEVLDALLRQPLIRKDVRSHRGETPLFISLAENADEAVIIKLIESDCDVTIPNLEDVTPLSLAMRRHTLDVADLLIQKGADIDAKDFDGYTPLHCAVSGNCYDAVCMLLYYNASVNEASFNSKVTPFMLAINLKNDRIAEVLSDYVADFNATDQSGNSTLYLALCSTSSLTKDILLRCGDVNNIEDCAFCLKEAMRWDESSIFRYIFSRMNHAKLAHKRRFLEDFMHCCDFEPAEFIECLHLILSSKYAWHFVDKCRTIIPIIQKFYNEKISQKDRVNTLYLLYASGLGLYYYEFWYIYRYFGFNEELETIFIVQPIVRNYSMCTGMFHFTENCINMAWNLFYNFSGEVDELQVWRIVRNNFQDILVDYLKFFTLDYFCKENYFCYYHKSLQSPNLYEELVQKMNERHIASLKELCRNKIRYVIICRSGAKDMYKLYDAIKALPLPRVLQDILHLKRPLYK